MKRTFDNSPVLHYLCVGGALLSLLATGFMVGTMIGEETAALVGDKGNVNYPVLGAIIGVAVGAVAWNEGGKRIVGTE